MLIEVFVDGAARGQGFPGGSEASCGVVIYRNRKMIGQFARGLGQRTNNEAEYEAVLHGILLCWAGDLRDPIIYSDSQLVVNQVNGSWQCNSPELFPLLLTIQDLAEAFPFRIQHVPRKRVHGADALARDFLDTLAERMESNGKHFAAHQRKRLQKDSGHEDEEGRPAAD